MSMTAYSERADRPIHEPENPRRAAGARRALTRWALRLALREWKQRILIVVLIAVATAATLGGIAVASATPGTPNAGTFGTAQTLIQLPGTTKDLPAVIAKIEQAYGAASVVYDQPIVTGQTGGADLRAQDPNAPATIVLIISVLGLVFIGLVATASFTVLAQRRQRALGVLASIGATESDVRFVLVADGLAGGVTGAVIGAAIALGGWLWYYPHLATATAHRIDPFALPWAAVITGLLLAVATSVIAAVWPARSVSKIPVVAAISGRVDAPELVRRSLRPGLIFLLAGLFVLFFSGGPGGGGGVPQGGGFVIIAGLLCCEIAVALLAPFAVDRLARLAWRAPLASRLAMRDLARYRSRSGAALAAVSFAVFIATVAIVIASVRFDDALDYTGTNLSPNQLILYTASNDPSRVQPGQFTPAGQLAVTRKQADALAAQLHAPAPLELDVAVSPNQPQPAISRNGPPSGNAPQNQPGAIISLHGQGSGPSSTWPPRRC